MIAHLLIACGAFAVGSCLTNFDKFPTSFPDNQIDRHNFPVRQVGSTNCPEKNGRFPVSNQCDAYIECIDGVPEEKLCPDGLLFNPDARFNYPCGYPIDVDCKGRANRQPPQPTADCPHQYGYFKVGDRKNCGQFMNCASGRGYIFDCPEGLAFNSATYRCDWPDQVEDCDAEDYLGFRCPEVKEDAFYAGSIQYFKSNQDCQHFYICVNDRPRLLNCGDGYAFNELIDACDAAENVTGCSDGTVAGPPTTKGRASLRL